MELTELNEHFSRVLAALKEDHAASTIDLWFKDSFVADFDGRTVTVALENDFKKNTVSNRYRDQLKQKLCEELNGDFNVTLITKDDVAAEESSIFVSAPQPYVAKQEEPAPDENDSVVGSGYTFENFVVGSSNKVAHSACIAVAERPAGTINPLFLYGPSGLGKTHLLFAIVNSLRKRRPHTKVRYVTGEQFTNELIDAITKKNTALFRSRYRNLDMLLIDDIQFIAGKMVIQEEFFHTFDTLYKLQKQIVLTSDKTPKEIEHLEERLRTRFEMGLIADIQPPEPELRTAIFKQKTQSLGLDLPNDVLAFLADNIRSNVRQIEGAVKKLWAQSFITSEEITLDMAKSVLSDYFSKERSKITPDLILEMLSKRYGMPTDEIKGNRRTANTVYVRHMAIYLIREYTDLSLNNVGKIFNRDHSTIISAYKGVEARIKNDSDFNKDLHEIKAELDEK